MERDEDLLSVATLGQFTTVTARLPLPGRLMAWRSQRIVRIFT